MAGGRGLRIPEETYDKAKPLIQIGELPILTHIMKLYDHWGHKDFIICLGYRGYSIKEYFLNYYLHNTDVIMNLKDRSYSYTANQEDWRITLAETGEETNTGGRLLRVAPYIEYENTLLFTYGDGLCDVNINDVIKFHKQHGKYATVVAVNSPSKFGAITTTESGLVDYFAEKSKDTTYINGGFFVLEAEVFKYIKDDKTSWEFDVLPELVKDKQLMAYRYRGFWKSMDSLKDKMELEEMWKSGKASWKVW